MQRTSTTTRKFSPFFDAQAMQQGEGGVIDWSRVGQGAQIGSFNVVLNGAVAADAVSITVDALEFPLKKGAVLQSGADEYITVTDDVEAGETTVPVEAVTTALEDNDVLIAQRFASVSEGNRFLAIGTVMCRTSDGLLIPRSVGSGSGTEVAGEILRSDAYENSKVAAKSGYGTVKTGGLYENLMPDADGSGNITSGWKTELAAAGCQFWFTDYVDSRAS